MRGHRATLAGPSGTSRTSPEMRAHGEGLAAVDGNFWDVAVLGGGPVGLAAAVAAAERGLSVVVVERHDFVGGHGSSSGAERQWRHQYAEPEIAELTLHARDAWRRLESRARRTLVHETGSLWFGDPRETNSEGQIDAAAAVLDELSIEYTPVDAATLGRDYGFVGLPAEYRGFFQPQGGVIDVDGTRATLVRLATGAGCALRGGTTVHGLELDAAGARLYTQRGEIRARHAIVTAGAWAPDLLRGLGIAIDFTLFELTSTYFRATGDRDYPTWFAFRPPTPDDGNLYYGFGRAPWAGDDLVQMSVFAEGTTVDAIDRAARTPRPEDLRYASAWVAEHMPGLRPEVVATGTCLAALPSDPGRQFYLGGAAELIPHGEHLAVCVGGWAFKFVPLFGKACVDLVVDGYSAHALPPFALRRAERPVTA